MKLLNSTWNLPTEVQISKCIQHELLFYNLKPNKSRTHNGNFLYTSSSEPSPRMKQSSMARGRKWYVSEWDQLPCSARLYRGLKDSNCPLRHSLQCKELLGITANVLWLHDVLLQVPQNVISGLFQNLTLITKCFFWFLTYNLLSTYTLQLSS